MDKHKKTHSISLCMGSSCYVNGNVPILQFVQQFLKQNNLEECVELKGSLCQGNCKNGPSMIIDGESFTHLNTTVIQKMLSKKLLQTAGKQNE
jgi:NADH:ubiquinone oxidoreductase subunit E